MKLKLERHHLLYPKRVWNETEAGRELRQRFIRTIERRPHGAVHVMVQGIKVPSDAEQLLLLMPCEAQKPSEACEWLARRTRDSQTRQDLLAEAYILSIEGL